MLERPPALSPHGPESVGVLRRIGRMATVYTAACVSTFALQPSAAPEPPAPHASLEKSEEPVRLSSLPSGSDLLGRDILLDFAVADDGLPARLERTANGTDIVLILAGRRYVCHDTVPVFGRATALVNGIEATGDGGMRLSSSFGTAELTASQLQHLAGPLLLMEGEECAITLYPRLEPAVPLWDLPETFTITIRCLDAPAHAKLAQAR